jgi:hypothetical protein
VDTSTLLTYFSTSWSAISGCLFIPVGTLGILSPRNANCFYIIYENTCSKISHAK